MNAAAARLADRIETGIRERAEKRVDEALARARETAFRAYADALRAPCGLPFEVVVATVMGEAEASLRLAALMAAKDLETDITLKRLDAAIPEQTA